MTLTSSGLTVRTQPELEARLVTRLQGAFPGIDFSEGPEQQFVSIVAEELAIAWETLQEVYSSQTEEGAQGVLLEQRAALTGTRRRAATRTLVAATVNLNAGVTLPAVSTVAAVDGNADAEFRLQTEVTNAGGSAADVAAIFEAIATGPVAAPAGTLTAIVTPVTGWNSITNALDGALGLARAEDPELRVARRTELDGAGAGTVDTLGAVVARVDGVLAARSYENTTEATDSDGRPAKTVEVVVWDGAVPAADDDAIAQAIWDAKGGGIRAFGAAAESGTAVDRTGNEQAVPFSRAAVVNPVVVMTVIFESTVATSQKAGILSLVQSAIVAHGLTYLQGETCYATQLVADAEAVGGVEAVATVTVDGGTTTPATVRQIIRIDSSDVSVTEAP